MSTRIAVLPQVGHGVRVTVRGVRLLFGEVGWWLGGGFRLLRAAPRRAVTWLTGVGFAVWAEVWSLLAVLLVLVVLPGLWARCWPMSFQQRISHPSWRRRIRRGVRRSWPRLMEACGLSRRVLDPTGAAQTRVPVLHRVRWDEPDVLVTVPQLMVGQTVEDVVTASERLRVAVGSRQVRVVPNDTQTGCTVRFLFADPLAQIVHATFPAVDAVPNIDGPRWGSPKTASRGGPRSGSTPSPAAHPGRGSRRAVDAADQPGPGDQVRAGPGPQHRPERRRRARHGPAAVHPSCHHHGRRRRASWKTPSPR